MVFVRVFCTRPTKNGGSEMCDILWRVPGCVTGAGGSKIVRHTLWTAPYVAACDVTLINFFIIHMKAEI